MSDILGWSLILLALFCGLICMVARPYADRVSR